MPHDHHLTVGSFLISGSLFLIGLVYLRQWMRVAWLVPDGVKGWRACTFFVGLLLVWVALGTSLAVLDHQSLTAHMVQHLLLMTVAPPLILLGVPWKLLPERPAERLVELIARALRSAPIQHLGRVLAHPVVCWLGAAGTLVVWHVPAVFMLGIRSEMWHEIEQASFLATGLLFWWPVVQPWPTVSKWPESSMLLYLFLATLPCDILSGFLVFCDRVIYPVFLSSSQSFGLSALEDQQCAGALMWTCVTVVYLIAATIVATRLLSPHRSEERPMLQFESVRSAVGTAPHGMEAV
jgi:cytochrome c oxidase assembly factor CtaG